MNVLVTIPSAFWDSSPNRWGIEATGVLLSPLRGGPTLKISRVNREIELAPGHYRANLIGVGVRYITVPETGPVGFDALWSTGTKEPPAPAPPTPPDAVAWDSIVDKPELLETKGNSPVSLTSSTDSIGEYVVESDGTSSGSWPDRMRFLYKPTGVAARVVQWWNEYFELRLAPALRNTVAFRVFVGDTPADYANRDNAVPVMEVASDRTNRVRRFGVFGNGDVYAAGTVTADNVQNKVVCVEEGTSGWEDQPDGTLWIEYEAG